MKEEKVQGYSFWMYIINSTRTHMSKSLPLGQQHLACVFHKMDIHTIVNPSICVSFQFWHHGNWNSSSPTVVSQDKGLVINQPTTNQPASQAGRNIFLWLDQSADWSLSLSCLVERGSTKLPLSNRWDLARWALSQLKTFRQSIIGTGILIQKKISLLLIYGSHLFPSTLSHLFWVPSAKECCQVGPRRRAFSAMPPHRPILWNILTTEIGLAPYLCSLINLALCVSWISGCGFKDSWLYGSLFGPA